MNWVQSKSSRVLFRLAITDRILSPFRAEDSLLLRPATPVGKQEEVLRRRAVGSDRWWVASEGRRRARPSSSAIFESLKLAKRSSMTTRMVGRALSASGRLLLSNPQT